MITNQAISSNVIHFESYKMGSGLQNSANTAKTCFRTDERYFCKDRGCGSWQECQKLVAEWMR